MKLYPLQLLFCFQMMQFVSAQSPETMTIRKYTHSNSGDIIQEFADLLSIPNNAKDSINIRKNAAFVMEMMRKRGIQHVQLLEAASPGTPPSVYGEIIVPGAKETLTFYAHYDGQPVNPVQWSSQLKPYDPKIFSTTIENNGHYIPLSEVGNTYNLEWRMYARSASDDKAGVDALMNAYDAIIKSGWKPGSNLKFFIEGEEEAASPHLHEILEKYASLLKSDLWIICDGSVHQAGNKQIIFGVRGDAHLDITVYTSKRPLHSGHYGNWAPSPAMLLVKLLASMKDENGRVLVSGFYNDVIPLGPEEKKALEEVPPVDDQLKNELGIHSTEMKGMTLGEAINQPSLNINGIQSGNVGAMASNQIPATATAVIDLRLVLGNDWRRQQQKVISHIKAQGFFVINREPTDEERNQYSKIIKVIEVDGGYNAQRTSMNLPIIKKVIEAVKKTTPEQVVLQPTMGASLPLFLFEKYLHTQTITVPIVNHDNNEHAENENIRLQNLFDGIESMAVLMMIK